MLALGDFGFMHDKQRLSLYDLAMAVHEVRTIKRWSKVTTR